MFFTKITQLKSKNISLILRSDFIKDFLNLIPKNCKIISTTGYTSRELMEIRQKTKSINGKDFYMVGGMGHASLVALSTSLHSKSKVICLDGDGSLLMHLGPMFSCGFNKNLNIKHILINNNSHESVGGQITGANKINLIQVCYHTMIE